MLGFLTLSDHWGIFVLFIIAINIGNRTECSPIQPVIIRVINKSDNREAEVRFVNHEYDYMQSYLHEVVSVANKSKLDIGYTFS